MKYYKVLIDGKSIHGGNLEWDLPKGKKPGKWHSVNGKILKCQSGLHLTTKPYKWFKWGADVFEAEGKGIHDGDEDKIAFKSARLIKKLDKQSWLIDAEIFVDSIKNIKWFSNGKLPRSEKIKMFKTRAAALMAQCLIAEIKGKHLVYAKLRWSVWSTGYGVLCDVNGILYCYEKP